MKTLDHAFNVDGLRKSGGKNEESDAEMAVGRGDRATEVVAV
jgi:hypothetical protein